MTEDYVRCPWAIDYGILATRCIKGVGHAGATRHRARGFEDRPGRRYEWEAGDPLEFRTDRADHFAWESDK